MAMMIIDDHCSGMQNTLRHGFSLILLRFIHFLSPNTDTMRFLHTHPHEGNRFPIFTLFWNASESFSRCHTLNPPCCFRSSFAFLCSLWRYFAPPLHPLLTAVAPSDLPQKSEVDVVRPKGFLSSIPTSPLARPRCISLDVHRTRSTPSTRQPCSSISHTLINGKLEEKPVNQMGREDWICNVLVLMETILH